MHREWKVLKDGNSLVQIAHEECRFYFKHHVVTYFEADLLKMYNVLPPFGTFPRVTTDNFHEKALQESGSSPLIDHGYER